MTFHTRNISLLPQNFTINNILWFISLVSFPLYLFPSGGPQVSTIFFVMAMLGVISKIKLHSEAYKKAKSITLPLFLFVIYTYIITLAWVFILNEPGLVIAPVFFTYNFIILFCLTYKLLLDYDFIKVIVLSTVCSVILQFILSFIVTSESIRGVIFFDNPNQLGYFSLISACLLTIFIKKYYITNLTYILTMLMCVWLGQLSLSKAAMVAGILLLIYGLTSSIKTLVQLMFITCLGYIVLLNIDLEFSRIDAVIDRLSSIGKSNDDNYEARGYDRIFNHLEMLVLGGAEGATYRWKSLISTHEMHSTWGTILFSYGIVGVATWGYFLIKKINYKKLYVSVPLLCIFLYGITHNGLRFTLFWVLLSVMVAVNCYDKRERLRSI